MIIPEKKYKKLKKFSEFEINSMKPKILMCWKKAKGNFVWDTFNKKLIDFTSTIFVTNVGHANKTVIKEVKKTLNSPISHSYNYYNMQRYLYSKSLVKFINNKKLNKCYLLSAGTEATEAALKLMRLNGLKLDKLKKKIGIITFKGNWHGRTMGAQMMSGKNSQSEWIGSYDKYIYQLDFPYPWNANEKNGYKFFYDNIKKTFGKSYDFRKRIAGIILEAFQGWGAFFYPLSFIKALKEFCKKNKILITIDEMQSGFGRTGYKFLYEYYKLNPDIVCCGKAMGSGFPISGVLSNSRIMNLPKIGDMSSTHSANPVVCSAALATISEINRKKLVRKSKELGKTLNIELIKLKKNFPHLINYVNSKGLIGAIIFKDFKKYSGKKLADKITLDCYKRGLLLVNTGRESIKLGPPLIISRKLLLKSLKIIHKSFLNLKIK